VVLGLSSGGTEVLLVEDVMWDIGAKEQCI
jgi:hypothetical protein